MSVPLTSLPDSARVWVYGTDRPLTPEEREALIGDLRAFVDVWTAHGAALKAGVEWVEDRFAVVAVDETSAPASGCSIDAMSRRLAALEARLGCSLLDSTRVFYRAESGTIESCPRAEFRTRAAAGTIGEATPVFDPTIDTLAALRAGELERPVSRSWHRQLLGRSGGRS
ncbi:ABC transporter ATPase [Candidatus Palauibacter sp.]|uniref:ABC transporter ATPase n=1 Tax=Candidatus Palauibacter sp. TaxID=3101350 RepID=UPI003B51CFA1